MRRRGGEEGEGMSRLTLVRSPCHRILMAGPKKNEVLIIFWTIGNVPHSLALALRLHRIVLRL